MYLLKPGSKTTLLVVTAGFPKLNQPWIDTYLEQLLLNSFEIQIYSNNRRPKDYQSKVDQLNLRRFVVPFDMKMSSVFLSMIKTALLNPICLIHASVKAYKTTSRTVEQYKLPRLSTFLKLLRFGISERTFQKIHLIHAHSESLAYEFLLLALMRNIPIAYTFHGLLPKGVQPLIPNKRKALYAELSSVFVNTEYAKQQVLSIGCPTEKIEIIPQGLPIQDFPFVPRKPPTSDEPLLLLTVGRYHRDKGHRYALLALRRLLDSGLTMQWKFVGSGPERTKLLELASKLKLTENVTFHVNLDSSKLLELYHTCHLFVLPSISTRYHTETQGVVLQEAQASGCIPIATRVGGIPECVNHQIDALLVKEKSSRSISDAVLFLMCHPDQWESYQLNGRRNVESRFHADVIGNRMASNLRKLL